MAAAESRHEVRRAGRLLSAVTGLEVSVTRVVVTVRAGDVVVKAQPDYDAARRAPSDPGFVSSSIQHRGCQCSAVTSCLRSCRRTRGG